MTPEEQIRGRKATLVLDAANLGGTKLREVATLALEVGVPVVIPGPSFAEYSWRARRSFAKRGRPYDPLAIQDLVDKGVRVIALDRASAEEVAQRLVEWYPTDEAWQQAKRGRRRVEEQEAVASGRRASATIDWLMAGMCSPEGVLVSGDRGEEFGTLSRIKPEEAKQVLTAMRPPPSSRL